MADNERPEQRIAPPPAAKSAIDLLIEDVSYTNWEYSIALQKSFYVRGATWFHANVLNPISDLQKRPTEDFVEIFRRFPAFNALDLKWDEKFSPRQAMSALSLRARQPIKFYKAVQTVLLCDQITRERVKSGDSAALEDEALRRMRIEPAVFYIQDFDSEQLEEFKKTDRQILETLREETGQRSRVVFGEMASGHTVTKELADKTRDVLISLFPDRKIGAVDFRYRPGITQRAAPTEALSD